MKLLSTKSLLQQIVALFIVSTFIINITSCSSKKDDLKPDSKETTLRFSLAGISMKGEVKLLSVNKNKLHKSASLSSEIIQSEIHSFDGFDVMFNVEQEDAINGREGRHGRAKLQSSLTSASAKSILAASSPVTLGVKFRMLIYNEFGTVLLSNTEVTSGNNLDIVVDAGVKYKWVAFSINENTVPNINGNTIARSAIANKNVLYATGLVDTQFGENNINIVFDPHSVRFDVLLDTRGVFGAIENTTSISAGMGGSAGTFSNIIKTGDLNLLTGDYSNLSDIPDIKGSDMVNIENSANGGTVKIGTFYTVDRTSLPSSSVYLRLNKLKIILDDNSIREFNDSFVPLNNVPFTPTFGYKSVLNLRLIESGFRVGGMIWARTNLTYEATFSEPNRFLPEKRADALSSSVSKDYWNWLAITPTATPNSGDPCALVFPAGVWRMPTSAELATLGTQDVRRTSPGLIAGNNIEFVWNLDAGAPAANTAYLDVKLNLKFYGFRSTTGSINNSPTVDPSPEGQLHYWSSTSVDIDNANYLYGLRQNLTPNWTDATVTSGLKTVGRSVRCVRASAI